MPSEAYASAMRSASVRSLGVGLVLLCSGCASIVVNQATGIAIGGIAHGLEGIERDPNPAEWWSCTFSLTGEHWAVDYVGRVGSLEVLPEGQLYVARGSISRLHNGEKTAWLIVVLDKPNEAGVRSYATKTKTNCATRALSVSGWVEYSADSLPVFAPNAGLIRCYPVKPTVTMAKPSKALALANRAICQADEVEFAGPLDKR